MKKLVLTALAVLVTCGVISNADARCRPCRKQECETITECGPAPVCKKDISFTACAPAIKRCHKVYTFECPPGFEECPTEE